MTWATNPTFVAGTVCTAGNLNILSTNLALLQGTAGRIYATATTSLPNAALTTVSLGGTSWTVGGMSHTGDNLVVPVTGRYAISGACTVVGSAGTLEIQLFIAGSSITSAQAPLNSGGTGVCSSDIEFIQAGQTVGMAATQTSGGTLSTFGPSGQYTYLSVALVAPQ